MAFCRATLIKRLLNDNKNAIQQSSTTLGISRSWNDIDSFERDNIMEVYQKLSNIEEEIWGKIIIMERNIRSAKAYLRSRVITVDGSETEYDGSRIGLQQFDNTFRDNGTIRAFETFEKGVKMKIDDFGNVWLKCTEGSVYVNGLLGGMIVKNDPIKIFDLKIFKQFIKRKNDFDEIAVRDRYSRMAITYTHIDKPTNPLSSALWFAIIHLTALELIQVLLPNNSALNVLSPSTSSELQSINHYENYVKSNGTDINCNGRTVSLTSSGSGSSSHYSGVNSAYWNRQLRSRGGAYKKINRETNLYSSSRNALNFEQEQRKQKGQSLLDLSDLDQLRNPVYFRKEQEKRYEPGHKRLNHFTQQISSSSLKPFYFSNIGWRSRSETSLCCERL